MLNLNPLYLLETLQVQSKYGNVDGRFISHKMARKATGLTGATARAMKIHGGVAAEQMSKARKAFAKDDRKNGNYNTARARQTIHFGKAERAEGNGKFDEAEAHDDRARFFGITAKDIKNS